MMMLPILLASIESEDDRIKFLDILNRYEKFIYNFTRSRMAGVQQDVDDVVQEVYVQIIKQLKTIRTDNPDETKHLIARIITAKVFTYYNKKEKIKYTDDDEILDTLPGNFILPEEYTLHSAIMKEYAIYIYRLKPLYQSVFLDRLNNVSHKEIAMRYGITEDYSKKIFERARKKLKIMMSVRTNG